MLTRDALQRIKDPASTQRWWVMFPDIRDPYEVVAEQAEFQFAETPAKSRYAQGGQRYYPDAETISAVSMTFYETYDYAVTRYLNRWRSLIRRSDGYFGLPVDYKRRIEAHLYYPNANRPVLTLKYGGCWPTNQGPFSMTHDDAEGTLQVQATFSVDTVELG